MMMMMTQPIEIKFTPQIGVLMHESLNISYFRILYAFMFLFLRNTKIEKRERERCIKLLKIIKL